MQQVILPSINCLSLNRDLLKKIVTIKLFVNDYDAEKTYAKASENFINAKHLKFDKNIAWSLDYWLANLREIVVRRTQQLALPLPIFDDQQLIDLVCVLVYLVDSYLEDRPLNLKNIGSEIFDQYFDLLKKSHYQLFTLFEILNKCIASEKLTCFCHKQATTKCTNRQYRGGIVPPQACRNPFANDDEILFIPIQETSIENWKHKRLVVRTTHGSFLRDVSFDWSSCSSRHFNKTIKKPKIVFGLTNSSQAECFVLIYNNFKFEQVKSVRDMLAWLNCFFVQDSTTFTTKIQYTCSLSFQDFFLVLESWLRYKYVFASHRQQSTKSIKLVYTYSQLQVWPFNNTIFTFYFLAYVYAVYFVRNSREKEKRFSFSFLRLIQETHLTQFDVNSELFDLFTINEKNFTFSTNVSHLRKFGKYNE